MLFEKKRTDRWRRLMLEDLKCIEMAAADEPQEDLDSLWEHYHKYSRKMYRYEQKRWLKQAMRTLKNAHPYGAFYCLPRILFDMIQRCYEYWNHGYNVWVADEYTRPIREQTEYAWKLAQECMNAAEIEHDSFPQDKLIELFNYVAQHVNGWSD